MFKKVKRTGQATLELVILFIVIAAAVLTMQNFIKRAVMNKTKEQADRLGPQFSLDDIDSYTTNVTVTGTTTTETYGGGIENVTIDGQKTTTSTTYKLKKFDEEQIFD